LLEILGGMAFNILPKHNVLSRINTVMTEIDIEKENKVWYRNFRTVYQLQTLGARKLNGGELLRCAL
jgi:hypothetical protein